MKIFPIILSTFLLTSCVNANPIENSNSYYSRSNVIRVFKTDNKNKFGNNIWIVQLPDGTQFEAVTGRHYTQNRNRNTANIMSPLPKGTYSIGQIHSGPFGVYELGDSYFVDIHPLFSTQRSYLGIHYDPSFNKDSVNDGTSGCLGLTSKKDLEILVNYIRQNRVEVLKVET